MNPNDYARGAPGQVVQALGGYLAYLPQPLPPTLDLDWPLVGLAGEARAALGELSGLLRGITNPHLLYTPFLRREAVLSSRIEGTQAGLQDVVMFETGVGKAVGPDDVLEVANYVHALEYGLEQLADHPVSLRLMREMHRRLFEGLGARRVSPGEFRKDQNWIGRPGSSIAEARFVPPPADEMLAALAALEGYIHADSELPALLRLALIHYQFEVIHPFRDGNGRIGRLLIPLLMVDWELLPGPALVLSAWFERHRDDYYGLLLAVSQRGAWREWIEFVLEGIRVESRDAIRRLRALGALRESYRTRILQSSRSPAITLRIVDELFESPAVGIPDLARRLGVTQRTIQLQVARLEEAGILQEATGKKRDRIFVAKEILDLL